mmetsp:Transcript_33516/g.44164  ORF Transcript_33516/g.44164 Transcript_33516/m.44164 type:complete len:82 (+) Transcript_33516:1008-1253(+)
MDMRIADLNLMEMVREHNFTENNVDLAILYEITGFQQDAGDDIDFWANYESYRSDGWNTQMAINREEDDDQNISSSLLSYI